MGTNRDSQEVVSAAPVFPLSTGGGDTTIKDSKSKSEGVVPNRPPCAPSPCESCVGYCCRMFYLRYTLTEFRDLQQQNRKSPREWEQKQAAEIDMMLARFVPLWFPWFDRRKAGHRRDMCIPYTCRSYNQKTGRCNDYNNRPQLCHDFKCGAFHLPVGGEAAYHCKATGLTQRMFFGGGWFKRLLADRVMEYPQSVSFVLWWVYGGDDRNKWVGRHCADILLKLGYGRLQRGCKRAWYNIFG